ncbi:MULTISPECIES: hypothetical protein [Morganellaceae]|uniref:hypothetical protein n=1 Tax=Morganellaceae TaxID=1903414 RepID=UPI001419FB66|nr:hypothetical protein [Providencia heimbachae]NIH21821.1 hypothetical protein [Providencia heimbachae]
MKFEEFPEDVRKAAIESYQNAIRDISPTDSIGEEIQKAQLKRVAKNIAAGYSELLAS